MACCILGALIISQVLVFRRYVLDRLRWIWVTCAAIGVGLLGFGTMQTVDAWSRQHLTLAQAIAWCWSAAPAE